MCVFVNVHGMCESFFFFVLDLCVCVCVCVECEKMMIHHTVSVLGKGGKVLS